MPALLLGLGFGGFIDGIVLHEILQWHHMVSHVDDYPMDTLAGLEVNVVADGFFHVATWLLVWAGTTMTVVAWRQGRLAPNWPFHIGLLLVGWGIFNVVEGLIDHQILQLHHVRDDLGAPLSWDIGFLVFGALLVAVGLAWAACVYPVAIDRSGRGIATAHGGNRYVMCCIDAAHGRTVASR